MGSYKEDLLAVGPEIDSFDEKHLFSIGMPYIHYLQEVQLNCSRLLVYKEEKPDINTKLDSIEKVKRMVGACRELLSRTSVTVFSSSANQKAWNAKKEEAEYLLYDIKEAGVYACRKDDELLRFVYSIYNEGASNSDMIQDLNDYAVFGRKHQKLFDVIGYDKSNFDRAAQLSREMNELLPLATLDKSNSPERIRRNKAFCLTKNLIDELLAWARYIFHEDKNLASQFFIRPPRKKAVKKTEEKKETQVLTQ